MEGITLIKWYWAGTTGDPHYVRVQSEKETTLGISAEGIYYREIGIRGLKKENGNAEVT